MALAIQMTDKLGTWFFLKGTDLVKPGLGFRATWVSLDLSPKAKKFKTEGEAREVLGKINAAPGEDIKLVPHKFARYVSDK